MRKIGLFSGSIGLFSAYDKKSDFFRCFFDKYIAFFQYICYNRIVFYGQSVEIRFFQEFSRLKVAFDSGRVSVLFHEYFFIFRL